MLIYVNATNKQFSLEVENTDRVLHVKNLIREKEGTTGNYPGYTGRLVYCGKILEDSKTLAHYDVRPYTTFTFAWSAPTNPYDQ
ncbi:ubiquitin [Heterostelium album PN500]|uniref:Ubiquitin n=1 Tax=Heterostelium pallidum (strain ATCC 26659 / Pp 5 / PN500) TaxID=670386 RepID=D3B7D8_HETP5|nr:ubiquitin [Heterostelium album PN500]EFA82681.1 ubiquitin [Heterostelium album PN500]|eukprot:XP_020434798.1 ubiquitin [Heterostelium album PN500]